MQNVIFHSTGKVHGGCRSKHSWRQPELDYWGRTLCGLLLSDSDVPTTEYPITCKSCIYSMWIDGVLELSTLSKK